MIYLPHGAADVIRWLLVSLGVGTSPLAATLGGWPVYTRKEPGSPDEVITVYSTPDAVASGRFGDTVLDYPAVQVRFRAASEAAVQARMALAAEALDGVLDRQVAVQPSGTLYRVEFVHRRPPSFVGEEKPASRRFVAFLNAYACIKTE